MGDFPTRVFPTKHPFVENEDGSRSNVKLGTFSANNRIFVIPTMVNGGLLDNDTAWMVAEKYGLNRYPSFKKEEEAQRWIETNHGSINESGFLVSPEPPQGERKKKQVKGMQK
tara:strand:- start:3232 stop:3570 length:339 start_codon:yes stop_codon:yes gene_type:complete